MMMPTKIEFSKRLYEWSLHDWEREIRDGYPFLKAVKYSDAKCVIKLMESLTTEERQNLIFALLKRRCQSYLQYWGETFTDEDRRLVQSYFDNLAAVRWATARNIPPGGFQGQLSEDKLQRGLLRECIVEKLRPFLGKGTSSSREWYYLSSIGSWQVMTSIDVGGTFHQLCYDHSIRATDSSRLIEGCSLFSWLGICGQTMWQGLDNSEAEWAAESLAIIVKHFMDAVPKLLEGLAPE
jgi:hypothetical protein